ncbi:UBP1-associated protein 2C-like [Arachis stenosperma]|uniref:UBP1-associated protein 2C n=1 Tax=Arachis hypogaea TaxID=3818 RepID=UPI000DECD9CC|nr:UBP1-associated protein 2C [Arachis hypogaea]XP_025690212.1 UBP1-associated protein 2C [Arachis hypogaea]XP_025690213.1 UBP1-associated protein 2C [Arachis hypogaea]XP_025690214.1 UBP1-associated protein 2C [Arachis hypogaea]XP_057750089.1 UBP1-associated protein 2C-like [Arachis stenosperma]XP_057750090.1 UBP1-associated protein 2C-like [Arachis stenosperma]XP_057750091.1 UBP1-associated protein 2C-like [Arachis stenosperma]XP_057750092.1 UBP1-associated protein 2C-like [Arachis stenospe
MDLSKKRKTDQNGDADSSPSQQPPPSTSLSADDIRKILQPFTHEQLIDLLQSASLRHPDVFDSVRSVADRDSTLRKLFVRGLAADTTTDTIRAIFSAYGDLDEAIVIFDKNTGKSKGYGFVTFSHVDGAVLALKDPSKKIDGRMTVTQLAASGGPGAASATDVAARKVFVGNVPFEIPSERLLSHFLAYGEVEEGPLGFDKSSGKTRGFAFFVYKTEEGARACLAEPTKTIDGHQVFCKLAVDNKKAKPQNPASGFPGDGMHAQQQQQQQPQPSYNAPMLISQYGGYAGGGGHGNGYGMQPSVPSYGNPVPAAAAGVGGYGATVGGGGYGNSQYGGPVSGEYGARLPPTSGGVPSGGFMDGSHYGGLPSSAIPSQQPQPVPMPRPAPPGGMYQGVPPYY